MLDSGRSPGWPLAPHKRSKRPGEVERALERAYERYLARQCQEFLQLVPKDGVRPLYARAREWACALGIHQSKDPMPSLIAFCRAHLPLPPFEVWLQDYRSSRLAHAESAARAPMDIEDSEPARVAVRGLEHGRRRWFAGLHLFKDGPIWRGYISFREDRSARRSGRPHLRPKTPAAGPLRTADIFCEEDPRQIEERFSTYRPETLQGFLRSTLP